MRATGHWCSRLIRRCGGGSSNSGGSIAGLLQSKDVSGGLVIGEFIIHLFQRAGESVLPVLPDLLQAMLVHIKAMHAATFLQNLITSSTFLIYSHCAPCSIYLSPPYATTSATALSSESPPPLCFCVIRRHPSLFENGCHGLLPLAYRTRHLPFNNSAAGIDFGQDTHAVSSRRKSSSIGSRWPLGPQAQQRQGRRQQPQQQRPQPHNRNSYTIQAMAATAGKAEGRHAGDMASNRMHCNCVVDCQLNLFL